MLRNYLFVSLETGGSLLVTTDKGTEKAKEIAISALGESARLIHAY